MTHADPSDPLAINAGEFVTAVRRGWRWIAGGIVAGLVAALLIVVFVPARFDARALVLIRTSPDASSAIKSRLGPLAELAPSALGLGGKEDLETELALLESRATLGSVVDSLRLQVRPVSPDRLPPALLVDSLRLPGRFAPRKVDLVAGRNVLPEGVVWATARAKGGIRVKLLDREETIDEVAGLFSAKTQGGDAVRLTYRGRDSITAAQVPNLAMEIYLHRRKTTDRGLNQRRFDFLFAKSDSVGGDFRRSAAELRRAQESQGLFAAEPAARALFDQAAALEIQRAEVRAEQSTLDALLPRVGEAGFDARLVAGVPSLLKSPAVNDIVSQLAKEDTRRGMLLARYADDAPEVLASTRASDSLRQQLVPLARTFRSSLARQGASLDRDLGTIKGALRALPGQGEQVAVREAELKRSATLYAGMGAQLLEARLAALTEGGDVRMVDPAAPPRKLTFPRPSLTFALGALVGLVAGLAVVFLGMARRKPE